MLKGDNLNLTKLLLRKISNAIPNYRVVMWFLWSGKRILYNVIILLFKNQKAKLILVCHLSLLLLTQVCVNPCVPLNYLSFSKHDMVFLDSPCLSISMLIPSFCPLSCLGKLPCLPRIGIVRD